MYFVVWRHTCPDNHDNPPPLFFKLLLILSPLLLIVILDVVTLRNYFLPHNLSDVIFAPAITTPTPKSWPITQEVLDTLRKIYKFSLDDVSSSQNQEEKRRASFFCQAEACSRLSSIPGEAQLSVNVMIVFSKNFKDSVHVQTWFSWAFDYDRRSQLLKSDVPLFQQCNPSIV